MKIYLFNINGKPGFRHSLAEAQAVLEDAFLKDPEISDVWWDDSHPYEARRYFYGGSHADFAADEAAGRDSSVCWGTTDQIIWPVSVGARVDPGPAQHCPFGGAELTMRIRTDSGCHQIIRSISEDEWSEERLKPHLIMHFAVNAGQDLAEHLKSKEGA